MYLWHMNILKLLFELFVLYLVYKLIVDFIIPIYQTTKQVKQKVGEMQNQMNEHLKKQQPGNHASAPKERDQKPAREDYIEFEELK